MPRTCAKQKPKGKLHGVRKQFGKAYHMSVEEYEIYEEEILPLYFEEEIQIPMGVKVANLEKMELKAREYENNGRERRQSTCAFGKV